MSTLDGFGSGSGEDDLLHCIEDCRDELRELMQRWDERLTIKNLSVVEKYLESRLAVTLQLNVFGKSYYVQFSALVNGKAAILEEFISGSNVDVIKGGHDNNRDHEDVLIHNVDVVKCVQGIIPSLVRLYVIDDESNNIGPRSLYRSALNSAYKFLPAPLKGKSGVLTRRATICSYDFAGSKIKRRPQIVDCITQDCRDVIRQQFSHFKPEYIMALGLFLDAETVKVSLDEGCEDAIEFVDVFIGPFDL